MFDTPKEAIISNEINENTINNIKKNMSDNAKSDITFNKLLELQLLIKKESGLKELCK